MSASIQATTGVATPTRLLPRPEILLPILVALGYLAFVVAGFGASFGDTQALPIYVYCGLLLVLLQVSLARFRSLFRGLYGTGAALFGLVFAGVGTFSSSSSHNFTRAPLTYLIVNVAALIVFGVDAYQRHRGGDTNQPKLATAALRTYRVLATDFAGLALLFGISSFLLDFLNTRSALRFVGVAAPNRPIAINLNTMFGLHLPGTVAHLEGLNLALSFAMATVWLLTIVVIGALTGVGAGPTSDPAAESASLLRAIGDVIGRGLNEAAYSLRSVLQIFLWMIPSFSIANFAISSVTYFDASARSGGTLLDLFNPFSAVSLANYQLGFLDLAYAVVAIVAVVLTVAVAEFDWTIITNTLGDVTVFARVIALTLVFFTLSLAVTNAAAILFGFSVTTPFQVGAATTVALGLFGANAALAFILSRARPRAAVPATVSER